MKPVIFVSSCLGFESCRWNGMKLHSDIVELLRPYVDFITACPEKEIGLGVPRDPIRVIEDKEGLKVIQPSSGKDVTSLMNEFSVKLLDGIKEVDAFILKDSSPSCGFKNVKHFAKVENKTAQSKGGGLFGLKVLEKFPYTAVEDEGRLTNFVIRELFLTRLFNSAAFREIAAGKKMKELVNFQAKNKLLFLAYNETAMRKLGRITANAAKKPAGEVLAEYAKELSTVFKSPVKPGAAINVFQHAFGYFSEEITKEERTHYLKQLDKFNKDALPLSAIVLLTMAYVARFKLDYLKEQTFFTPYPESLMSITDSGNSRR